MSRSIEGLSFFFFCRETFQNAKSTSEKLKDLNKTMIDLSKKGETAERLEG